MTPYYSSYSITGGIAIFMYIIVKIKISMNYGKLNEVRLASSS